MAVPAPETGHCSTVKPALLIIGDPHFTTRHELHHHGPRRCHEPRDAQSACMPSLTPLSARNEIPNTARSVFPLNGTTTLSSSSQIMFPISLPCSAGPGGGRV